MANRPLPPDVDVTDVNQVSVTACLWMLCRDAGSAPKSFYCPSSQDDPMEVDDPLTMAPADPNVARTDFESYNNCSYGYQIPFGDYARPTGGRDPRMPLAADKGPFGYGIDGGGDSAPANDALAQVLANAANIDSMSADEWRPLNSINHGGAGDGEGQNVLYTDTHVEWAGKPTVGIAGDNIYTRFTTTNIADPTLKNRAVGSAPVTGNNLAPYDSKDSMIYP
jgi:hypothetical protein